MENKFQKEHIWFFASLGLIAVVTTVSVYTLINVNNEKEDPAAIEQVQNPNAVRNPNSQNKQGETNGNEEIPPLEKNLFEDLPDSLRGGII